MIEEEGNDFSDNNFIKTNFNISDTISALDDNISTYTGVRSINEEQSIISNNAKSKISQKKSIKNKKVKKGKSLSLITESKDESRKNDEKSINENEIENENENENEKEKEKNGNKLDEIKTLFEWDGGGELVYITGSFCEWKSFYKMTKNEKGIFTTTLSLPRGFHQFKFKVDGNWLYSKNLPKFEDNGNVNNYIDTLDYLDKNIENSMKINNKENVKELSKEVIKNKAKRKKKKKKRNSTICTTNFINSQKNYTTYYPLKSELNLYPSSLPSLYKARFILNEDFKPKKQKKFSKIEYINDSSSESSSSCSFSDTSSSEEESSHSKITIFGEVIPYVKFQNLYHIHSNHLHSTMFTYKETTVTSITSRYRIKFSTFVYYKPTNIINTKRKIRHSKTVKIKKRKK